MGKEPQKQAAPPNHSGFSRINRMAAAFLTHSKTEEAVIRDLADIGGMALIKERAEFVDSLIMKIEHGLSFCRSFRRISGKTSLYEGKADKPTAVGED